MSSSSTSSENFSSSSSTSSEFFISSSSSSTSSSSSSVDSSSSSSSSGYCQYPECEGTVCANLINWYLEDASEAVLTDGLVYVRTVFFPATNTQQVELYSDSSYYNIVALGQVTSFVGTQIALSEMNNSGINGTVYWDGTPLDFSYSGILYCVDRSSSSSTSSIDSSSTSSESTQSNSSSSSNCCASVLCEGINCSYFSDWNFSGMADGNTTICTMYIGLFVQGPIQQVRVYREKALVNLTAVGQSSVAGSITLIEQNNSGLSGTVTWDGTLLPFPNTLALSCNEFSSSSSSSSSSIDSSSSSSFGYTTTSESQTSFSSSSSIDSSSSSSSAGYTDSSDSSASISSSSSPTSESSSSSSSIDSSSTSSESVGNVSSSSSSSGEFWNQTKPLILGLSSAANPNIKNRLAQTFKVFNPTYNIGKIYVYLYRARGLSNDYYIRLSISDCNDDGSPKDELYLESLHSSLVIKDDWYAFEFDITDAVTPDNGYLSVTLRHNGDENNFILWGYDESNDNTDSTAWTSNNSSNWEELQNTTMAVRVIGNFDIINTDENIIDTPPGEGPIPIDDEVTDGEIEYSNAILSFVVDSSGSMGMMDRSNNRQEIVNCLIDKFKSEYPSDIKFDVLSFGGSDVDVNSFSALLGSFATINLDLNSPSRTTYIFDVSGSSAQKDAVYEIDSNPFTVKHTLNPDKLQLVTYGSEDPIDSGTLNLVSGTGDATIDYSGFTKVTIQDDMIAYGFRTLENGHTYNVGDFKVDFQTISEVDLKNWQIFSPANESPTVTLGSNAPLDAPSIDILATPNATARKLFTNLDITITSLEEPLYVGGDVATVSDASGFETEEYIDIVQGDAANIGRQIISIDGNEITFAPPADFDINPGETGVGGIVQSTSSIRSKSINGTTANLLVRDRSVTRDVVFYLQNIEGYFMEWDFTPFQEWVSLNVFFFGETAILPMSFFQTDGTPFPDGTRVDLIVDVAPDLVTENEVESAFVTQNSFAGQTRIYVASTEGYFREQVIDILDKEGNIQTTEIEEIEEDTYIDIVDPLEFEIGPDLGTTIRPNGETGEILTPNDRRLATEVPVVDVTPIVNDKDVDPSLLKPYDLERVPISTPYEDLNTASEFFQKEVIDMPTVDGNCCARVLPIVEDILETIAKKEADFNRLQRYDIDVPPISQLEQNEGDEEQANTIIEDSAETAAENVDYSILTPVYTNDGLATSSMQSFSTDFTSKTFPGLNIPGISDPEFFAKSYSIYASAEFLTSSGRTLAKLYLDPFEISFLTPVVIDSTYVEEEEFTPTESQEDFGVKYYLQDPNPDDDQCAVPYDEKYVRGHHASDGNTITLNYVVAEKFILVNNKNINITLYTNRVADLDNLASDVAYGGISLSQQFVNIRPLRALQDVDGETVSVKTPVDAWRDIVLDNPFEEIIDSSGATNNDPDIDQTGQSISNSVLQQYYELLGGALSSGGGSEASEIFYNNPSEWTLAKQYDQYEFTIPIINGKASLEIPNSDIISFLFVEASVVFGENNENEQILADGFFVANPITVSGLSPSEFKPIENELYEIGASIEYLDGSTVIEDNVQVNFTFSETSNDFKVEPSSSVTDNGWAGGVFIGPIEPIEPQPLSPNATNTCPPKKTIEATIEVFHPSGYVRTITRSIDLLGSILGGDESDSFLFFANDASTSLYADGSENLSTRIRVDLSDSAFQLPPFVDEDGINRLKGFDQPTGARVMTAFNSVPRRSTWENNGIVDLFPIPRNRNIGHPKPLGEGEFVREPWSSLINAVTSYRKANGSYIPGQIASGSPQLEGLFGNIVIPKPVQKYSEPLGIVMGSETDYVRDGVTTSRIFAEVTWKGQPIIHTVTIGDGTEFETVIRFPFPKVTFESGICLSENTTEGADASAIDDRNLQSGCLTVGAHSDFLLSDYSVEAGLIRSSIHSDGSGNSHTHVTNIDENGNGTTTSVITLSGTVANHSHTFTNYSSNEVLGHSHSLRCVAVTNILPTTNIGTDFVVNGTVIYDPTNAQPYEREPVNPEGNRKMFATLRVPAGNELAKRLSSRIEIGPNLDDGSPIFVLDYETGTDPSDELEIDASISQSTSVTFYTAKSIDETIRGFDVRVFVKFPKYVYVNNIGEEVVVPEKFVDDGSRVTMEILAFDPLTNDGANVSDLGYLVMGAGIKRDYMNLKFKVSVTSEGFISTRQFSILIASVQQWYPSITHLVPTLTSDQIYLDAAINNFGFFGASQIHDAIRDAAQNLVQYQTDDETYKDYKKFIVLLTDGDENLSERSLSQAIDAVDFVDGKGQIQIIPIQLGQPHPSDSILLRKYANESDSSIFYLDNSSEEEINEVCDGVTSGRNLKINTVIISGEVVFEEPNIPSSTVINLSDIPDGSSVLYRIRTSIDGLKFGNWSEWMDYDIPFDHEVSLDSLQTVVQYEVKILGNSEFESPVMSSATVNYFDPKEFIVFFKPISVNLTDDEYISSIHVTSEMDVPENSVVDFLMTQSDSIKPEEYYDVELDQLTILPTRFNEILLTDNYKTYTAVNGKWPKNLTIEAYRLSDGDSQGTLIPRSEYSANSIEGTITFLSSQDPSTTVFMNVYLSSSFRIAARVKNYSADATKIHHVGVMYNISKRVPRSNDGTIIHVPISKRLT